MANKLATDTRLHRLLQAYCVGLPIMPHDIPPSTQLSRFPPPTIANSLPTNLGTARLTQGIPQNQYSAAYCTVNSAGILSHVVGGLPPAVFNRYTTVSPFVVLSPHCRYSQGTLPFLTPPGPFGASAGAGELETFLATAKPYYLGGMVLRSKVGVVVFRK
jgi:hypothetical protein